MFTVVVDLACENRSCPFRAVETETGDVIVQGAVTDLAAGLPTAGPGEGRLRFTAEQWAALVGK